MEKLIPDFIQDILRKSENDDSILVSNLENEPACGGMDNFASAVIRIKVHGKKKVENKLKEYVWNFIAKYELSEKLFPHVNSNEAIFYSKILPNLEQHCVRPLKFPKCYYSSDSLIILEDLAPKGYKVKDKFQGLTVENVNCILKELANYHASSMILKAKNPEKFTEISKLAKENLYFKDNTNILLDSQGWLVERAKEILEKEYSKNKNEDILKVIELCEDIVKNFKEKLIKLFETRRKDDVISHGDCWCNNFLFKGDDVYLIDLQTTRTTSVAADITYLLYINLINPETRINNMEYFLKIYLDELNNCLKIKRINTLNMEWLISEMKDFELFGFIFVIWFIPLLHDKNLKTDTKYTSENIPEEVKKYLFLFLSEYAQKKLNIKFDCP